MKYFLSKADPDKKMKTRFFIIFGTTLFLFVGIESSFAEHSDQSAETSDDFRFVDLKEFYYLGEEFKIKFEATTQNPCPDYSISRMYVEAPESTIGHHVPRICGVTEPVTSYLFTGKVSPNNIFNFPFPATYTITVNFDGKVITQNVRILERPDVFPPLKQFADGIAFNEIQCKEELNLVIKHDDTPACVKLESISKLVERGWINATSIQPTNNNVSQDMVAGNASRLVYTVDNRIEGIVKQLEIDLNTGMFLRENPNFPVDEIYKERGILDGDILLDEIYTTRGVVDGDILLDELEKIIRDGNLSPGNSKNYPKESCYDCINYKVQIWFGGMNNDNYHVVSLDNVSAEQDVSDSHIKLIQHMYKIHEAVNSVTRSNMVDGNLDACYIDPVQGTCEALIYKHYFDRTENVCKEFLWGGCTGVVPFETLEDCQLQCISK